ncbi:gamma-glutamylputrescine synthetase [Haloarcula rubripromontorii]|uniref:gamma-glutamylputrescine synthetase n=1 Tax=Haloarcula rubripromontorii TaxID=1705562 RepID=UPI00345C5848
MTTGDKVPTNDTNFDLVRLVFVTQSGAVRAHEINAEKVDTAVENGTPISELVQSYNAFGRRDKDGRLGAAGEVKLQPDPETMRSLPYAEQTGCMLCNIETLAGNPWPIDPRSSLQKFISEMAYQPAVAFESEFHLFTRDSDGEAQPLDTKGVYLTESTRETHETIRRIVTALESQGLVVEKYYPEYAAGKHEVVIGHQPGLRAVDEHILLRETVKSVARTDDFRATFLPRPFGTATNGCHIHLSLWDDANRFYDSAKGEPSELCEQFIAGILTHASALLALTAPTANSYTRLRPQYGAAGFVCWGTGNREALVRIPATQAGTEAQSTRIEFRGADNTINPYLALIGLLAAGADGIQRELEPPKAVTVDPGTLSPTQRAERGIERLPQTLGAALDALATNETMREVLGDELLETYLEVKRSHWDAFTESARSWNRDRLRRIY